MPKGGKSAPFARFTNVPCRVTLAWSLGMPKNSGVPTKIAETHSHRSHWTRMICDGTAFVLCVTHWDVCDRVTGHGHVSDHVTGHSHTLGKYLHSKYIEMHWASISYFTTTESSATLLHLDKFEKHVVLSKSDWQRDPASSALLLLHRPGIFAPLWCGTVKAPADCDCYAHLRQAMSIKRTVTNNNEEAEESMPPKMAGTRHSRQQLRRALNGHDNEALYFCMVLPRLLQCRQS